MGHTQNNSVVVVVGDADNDVSESKSKKQKEDENALSLDELIELSDIIVVGKVISEMPVSYNSVSLSIGSICNQTVEELEAEAEKNFNVISVSIEVFSVLKGNNSMKTVMLAIPPKLTTVIGKCRNRLEYWKGPIYTKGMEGVWFLTKMPYKIPNYVIRAVQNKGNYYFANRSERYRQLDDTLIKKIKDITN